MTLQLQVGGPWARLMALLLCTACAAEDGRTPDPSTLTAADRLSALVEHELAFARAAQDQGVQRAFETYVLEDGVLFRPGPVQAGAWLRENQASGEGSLRWVPVQSAIASSGDLGYTTGPFISEGQDGQALHGQYLSVWKASNGGYRVALDIGHVTPEGGELPSPDSRIPADSLPSSPDASPAGGGTAELLAADRAFAEAQGTVGTLAALERYSASGVRLNRSGHFPATGLAQIQASLDVAGERPSTTPTDGSTSESGTLGYVYGRAELGGAAGNYVRIWQRDPGGDWRLAVELLDVAGRP